MSVGYNAYAPFHLADTQRNAHFSKRSCAPFAMSQPESAPGSILGLRRSDSGGISASTAQLVGPSKGESSSLAKKRFRPEPVTVSGISFVSTAWLAITVLLTVGCCAAFVLPEWMRADRVEALSDPRRQLKPSDYIYNVQVGMTWYRANYSTTGGQSWIAQNYHYLQFSADETDVLPRDASDVSVLLASSCAYGTGCGLLIISFFIGVLAYCKPRIKGASVFLAAFFFQLVAGMPLVSLLNAPYVHLRFASGGRCVVLLISSALCMYACYAAFASRDTC